MQHCPELLPVCLLALTNHRSLILSDQSLLSMLFYLLTQIYQASSLFPTPLISAFSTGQPLFFWLLPLPLHISAFIKNERCPEGGVRAGNIYAEQKFNLNFCILKVSVFLFYTLSKHGAFPSEAFHSDWKVLHFQMTHLTSSFLFHP